MLLSKSIYINFCIQSLHVKGKFFHKNKERYSFSLKVEFH